LEKMAETGQEMLRAAISAFMAKDANAAREAAAMDTKIDITKIYLFITYLASKTAGLVTPTTPFQIAR
jgi:phosphate uptake regulator